MSTKNKKKKTPPINFIINMKVYPFDVMVSIGQTDVQVGKSLDKCGYPLKEYEIELVRYTSDTCMGRYVMFENNASFIRLRKLPETSEDYGWMAHEIAHVAIQVLDRVGMKLQPMVSCEAYTYLIQYLTENIYKEINKYY